MEGLRDGGKRNEQGPGKAVEGQGRLCSGFSALEAYLEGKNVELSRQTFEKSTGNTNIKLRTIAGGPAWLLDRPRDSPGDNSEVGFLIFAFAKRFGVK